MGKSKKTLYKKIDNIITWTLLVFVFATVVLAGFLTYYKSKNKMVSFFGYSLCYVLTGSMEPVLHVGDVILIKKTDINQIKIGDIITYKSNEGNLKGQFITHRVVEISDGETLQFITKGDANNNEDAELITEEKIEGVFQRKIGFLIFVLSALNNPLIFLLVVITPILILFVLQLVNLIKSLKQVR